MKSLLLSVFMVFMSVTVMIPEAEAKRLGGSRSSGMQRDAAPQKADRATPPGQQQAAPAAAPKRNWLGPLAGLAAGIGLAALFSHLGMGEGMANLFMMLALAGVAFFAIRWIMGRMKPAAANPPMQYAGAGAGTAGANGNALPPGPAGGYTIGGNPSPTTGAAAPAFAPSSVLQLPADIDKAAFERVAKVNFLRLQAANDAGDLNDIREFTTPEMYAEIKLDIDDRKGAANKTDVVNVDAEVVGFEREARREVVSVRYTGMISEDGAPAAAFDETWHLTRPLNAKQGWLIAGIQQNG